MPSHEPPPAQATRPRRRGLGANWELPPGPPMRKPTTGRLAVPGDDNPAARSARHARLGLDDMTHARPARFWRLPKGTVSCACPEARTPLKALKGKGGGAMNPRRLDESEKARSNAVPLPAPDPARKADTLRLARENFDRQPKDREPGPSQLRNRPRGFMTGVKRMFDPDRKPGPDLTTAIVACGLVVLTPAGARPSEPARPVADHGRTAARPPDQQQGHAEDPPTPVATAGRGSGDRPRDRDTLADTLVAPNHAPAAEARAVAETVSAGATPSPGRRSKPARAWPATLSPNAQDAARVRAPPNTETFANERPHPFEK